MKFFYRCIAVALVVTVFLARDLHQARLTAAA